MAAKFVIHEAKLMRALDKRYEAYALSVGNQIRGSAIRVFMVQQIPGNEWRLSETTPPKYIASFKVGWNTLTKRARVSNNDPAWNMIEWGAHPGGNSVRVLRYKPLTRGFLAVASRA